LTQPVGLWQIIGKKEQRKVNPVTQGLNRKTEERSEPKHDSVTSEKSTTVWRWLAETQEATVKAVRCTASLFLSVYVLLAAASFNPEV
jgi:hypothetical protein